MESQGVVGRIQVTAAVYEKLKGLVEFETLAPIDIKGKGNTNSLLIKSCRTGLRASAVPHVAPC